MEINSISQTKEAVILKTDKNRCKKALSEKILRKHHRISTSSRQIKLWGSRSSKPIPLLKTHSQIYKLATLKLKKLKGVLFFSLAHLILSRLLISRIRNSSRCSFIPLRKRSLQSSTSLAASIWTLFSLLLWNLPFSLSLRIFSIQLLIEHQYTPDDSNLMKFFSHANVFSRKVVSKKPSTRSSLTCQSHSQLQLHLKVKWKRHCFSVRWRW